MLITNHIARKTQSNIRPSYP